MNSLMAVAMLQVTPSPSAGITGMAALLVSDFLEITLSDELKHLQAWSSMVRARPSWSA
jgi:hypothetical protein